MYALCISSFLFTYLVVKLSLGQQKTKVMEGARSGEAWPKQTNNNQPAGDKKAKPKGKILFECSVSLLELIFVPPCLLAKFNVLTLGKRLKTKTNTNTSIV